MEGSWKRNKLLFLFGFLHTMLPVSDTNEKSNQSEDETAVTQAVMSADDDALSKLNLPRKLPTILEIKRALPPHCFEPTLAMSLYYMFKDFALIGVLFFLSELTWPYLPPMLQLAITPVFWLVQGTLFTAIFVAGHDAGHESFSKSPFMNDLCGNVCHTFLFCPFYMWKLSHRKHHKNTGNMDKDEVFYPVRKRDKATGKLLPGFGLFVGWFAYLVKGYKPRTVEHFNPLEPLFRNHVKDCIISTVFMAVWSMCLYRFAESFGWGSLLYHHTVPVCVFGCYIVIITFLHHTEDEVPWYSDRLWDNVRGQLSSVDRHYGWCHDIIHNIGTHQIHHLFPKIPHYRLEEATAAFRKTFPKLVVIRSEPILFAFCRMFKKYAKQCIIEDDALIHLFK